MDLFTESIEATQASKKKFLQNQLSQMFCSLSYTKSNILKLYIEVEYAKHLYSYITNDDNDLRFENEIRQIILDEVQKKKEKQHIETLHFDLIIEGLYKHGIHNRF
jgi:regulator of replication initiation timing